MCATFLCCVCLTPFVVCGSCSLGSLRGMRDSFFFAVLVFEGSEMIAMTEGDIPT